MDTLHEHLGCLCSLAVIGVYDWDRLYVLCKVCYGVEETAFVIGTTVLWEVVADAEEIVWLLSMVCCKCQVLLFRRYWICIFPLISDDCQSFAKLQRNLACVKILCVFVENKNVTSRRNTVAGASDVVCSWKILTNLTSRRNRIAGASEVLHSTEIFQCKASVCYDVLLLSVRYFYFQENNGGQKRHGAFKYMATPGKEKAIYIFMQGVKGIALSLHCHFCRC